ncbi:Alkaline phosphatase [Thermodesulfatator indicus DSM 15286]|uniref:Alkaline phosphatase n=1 Tax=Thermodesulfatator indicus (strain DSM 15286 / JCM 11887 / CIR29812) TaxID=667014 RepID=F8ABL8_THEID|nr:alkaline phosphatase [Thermodesulfatator indicus]AEH45618.1 Alkaline phosphatase [Thermodesulfatator indicus DSM 15286]
MKQGVFRREFLACLATLVASFVFLLFVSVGQVEAGKAKYIFLFIGDGMGIPQRVAAEQFIGEKLLMDKLPAQGITTTYAANRFITGSAAAATAIACGHKTNIGMIGITPDGQVIKSVAELARDKGMKVGIISSVSIDHATPAGFYAHVKKRSQYYDIALQLAKSNFNFFGGGGFKDPNNKKHNSVNYQGNAFDIIRNAGYRIIRDKNEFESLKKGDDKVIVINPRLPDGKAEPYAIDQTPADISLAELTDKAIQLLDNKKGFFIMVEGGKIDWACHANDAVTAIKDTLAFNDAIKVAYDFYLKHPKDTLIVVTADHETGGLTLGFAGTKYASYFDVLHHQNISFKMFTDEIMKNLKKSKYITFEDVKPIITKYFGLKFSGDPSDPMVLKPYEIVQLVKAFEVSMKGKYDEHDPQLYLLYGGYDPLTVTITHILNHKAGLAWTSYKHTGVPIQTTAVGIYADLFNGYYDNTDIAKKIMKAMGITPKVYYVNNYSTETVRSLVANF